MVTKLCKVPAIALQPWNRLWQLQQQFVHRERILHISSDQTLLVLVN